MSLTKKPFNKEVLELIKYTPVHFGVYLVTSSQVFRDVFKSPLLGWMFFMITLMGLILFTWELSRVTGLTDVLRTWKSPEATKQTVQEWIYIWDSRTGADRIETLLNNREALIRERGVSIKRADQIYAWWLFRELFSILFCKFERVYKVFKRSKD